MIKVTLYDTQTLIGVFRNLQPPTTYWLDLCFPNEMHFDTEYVDFEQLSDVRRLAPFVMPLAQGRPIYSDGSRVTRLKPAYIKPKDPVSPARILKKRPGTLMDIGGVQSPAERYNAIIADILRAHSDAIWRRWEWMAAQATIFGSIVISGDAYPARQVDFGRDAGQSIASVGTSWADTVNPLDDIEAWRDLMRRALFGGPSNRLTMAPDVWSAFRSNTAIAGKLVNFLGQYAGGLNPNLGIRDGSFIENVGQAGTGLDVYVYSDYYQDTTGAQVKYLPDGYVVMTGPGVQGYRCFGAILDPYAQFQPVSIFPRMYIEDDPAVTFVMTQSAPLMVPLNPNCTLAAQPLND